MRYQEVGHKNLRKPGFGDFCVRFSSLEYPWRSGLEEQDCGEDYHGLLKDGQDCLIWVPYKTAGMCHCFQSLPSLCPYRAEIRRPPSQKA